MDQQSKVPEIILLTSILLIFAFLILARPPLSFLVLLLAPIALAAVLYDFAGGTLVALVAMIGVALLLALDPDAYRRAAMLPEVWPILVTYLVVGPFIGWLVARKRDSEGQLAETARRLHLVQEIVEVVNTSIDPQDTLRAIIAKSRRLVPFEEAAILMKTGHLLRVVATSKSDSSRSTLSGQAFELKDSAARVAIDRQQIWAGGKREVDGFADTRLFCSPKAASCLVIPLRFQ